MAKSGAHALIDAGALITGLNNLGVATELLKLLPPETYQAVVYLDGAGKKMVLKRGVDRPLPLASAGVDMARRFTFYDQAHCTGMDIKQTSVCVAIVSVSKDMSFRDLAQAAYRMRGVGCLQTLRYALIPEVRAQIKTAGSELALGDIAAYLYAQGFSTEIAQGRLLTIQTCNSVWRKQAFAKLLAEAGSQPDPACVEIFSEAVDTSVPN